MRSEKRSASEHLISEAEMLKKVEAALQTKLDDVKRLTETKAKLEKSIGQLKNAIESKSGSGAGEANKAATADIKLAMLQLFQQ